MIMRIVQVTTHPGKENEFSKFFHETAIPLMNKVEGIEKIFPGASRPESPREFTFVMIWRDLDSLKAFVEKDYTNPHIDPAEAEIVESRLIRHYDLVEA